MGCINSNGQFEHWFGNIHLSGSCNRSCYFCIGQHMQLLDALNNLDVFPLKNIDEFIDRCIEKNINEINVTGSNTDPLLYKHTAKLKEYIKSRIPNLVFGIRTNSVLGNTRGDILQLYDKGSITICSFDPVIYKKMMGQGEPPRLNEILPNFKHFNRLKMNVVLGDENVETGDILRTIRMAMMYRFDTLNLREPYGQTHIGNPMERWNFKESGRHLGMPYYMYGRLRITYWDVHFVEVESVNLYANGVVSLTYPVTKGHDPQNGQVTEQSKWGKGRHFSQWNHGKEPINY